MHACPEFELNTEKAKLFEPSYFEKAKIRKKNN